MQALPQFANLFSYENGHLNMANNASKRCDYVDMFRHLSKAAFNVLKCLGCVWFFYQQFSISLLFGAFFLDEYLNSKMVSNGNSCQFKKFIGAYLPNMVINGYDLKQMLFDRTFESIDKIRYFLHQNNIGSAIISVSDIAAPFFCHIMLQKMFKMTRISAKCFMFLTYYLRNDFSWVNRQMIVNSKQVQRTYSKGLFHIPSEIFNFYLTQVFLCLIF